MRQGPGDWIQAVLLPVALQPPPCPRLPPRARAQCQPFLAGLLHDSEDGGRRPEKGVRGGSQVPQTAPGTQTLSGDAAVEILHRPLALRVEPP